MVRRSGRGAACASEAPTGGTSNHSTADAERAHRRVPALLGPQPHRSSRHFATMCRMRLLRLLLVLPVVAGVAAWLVAVGGAAPESPAAPPVRADFDAARADEVAAHASRLRARLATHARAGRAPRATRSGSSRTRGRRARGADRRAGRASRSRRSQRPCPPPTGAPPDRDGRRYRGRRRRSARRSSPA